MKLRPIKVRITLLNVMLAIAVLAVTLAISRPRTELWPTSLAVTWVIARSPAHDPATHEALAQGFLSPEVIRDVLADPNVAGLARIKAATDPRQELLNGIVIEVHPHVQGNFKRTNELIRVVVEAAIASDAVIVRDALMAAYLEHDKAGIIIRGDPALPERVPHPLFDHPWKFKAALTLGLLSSVVMLLFPIERSKRFRLIAITVLAIGLILGAALWWLITHPEFYITVGGFRFL